MQEEINAFYEVPINPTDVCQRAFELMQEKQYEEAEKFLIKNMSRAEDNVSVGLFHSALGVLYKLRGEPKTAWKHYQRAEKLIPDDPALKIIVARLLIDEFAEYDQAIKRVKKILKSVEANPVFAHQCYVTMGLAYLGNGKKETAKEMLLKSMENDFRGFVTTQNIDFLLVEMLLRRKLAAAESKLFLEKARDFARAQKEETWVVLINKMIDAL